MGRYAKHKFGLICQFITGLLCGHFAINCWLLEREQILDLKPLKILDLDNDVSQQPGLPVFVGIMTATKYLNSRGCSAWKSWASHLVALGGDVKFFVGSSESATPQPICDLEVIVLKGVRDEDYPPQIKSFAMLKWMEENHKNSTSWFMRSDDDVFVDVDKLLALLGGINPSESHFIGQAGVGRGEEEGHLSLLWNQNFCMGGTGMLLSKVTLQHLAPKIDTCLANLLTTHEDVEVGRCVTIATGQTCTWAYQMQTLFHHSAGGRDERGTEVQPDTLDVDILNNAITIHPVKSPKNMEMLSVRFKTKKRLKMVTDLQKLHFDIKILENNGVQDLYDLPFQNATWDFIYGHSLYSAKTGHEKNKVPKRITSAIEKIVTKVLDKINTDSREKGRSIEFRDLYYAYVNNDPANGNSYILDILLVYKKFHGKKMTVKVRRHVFAREVLLEPHHHRSQWIIDIPSPEPVVVPGDVINYFEESGAPVITMLMAVAGDKKLSVLKRFLKDYEREVLLKMTPVRLVLVVFKETSQDTKMSDLVRNQVQFFDKEYPGCSITIIEKHGKFARGVGLTEGLNACQESDLVFVIDVDISFNARALENVRRFTVEGKSVYYPIVFSEFRDGGGFWRTFGYGIMSGYKSDILFSGGYNTDIKGWGKEDVDLFDKLQQTKLLVYRAKDPNLIHKYHKVTCSSSLNAEQAAMCLSSRANVFLPLNTLYSLAVNSSLISL